MKGLRGVASIEQRYDGFCGNERDVALKAIAKTLPLMSVWISALREVHPYIAASHFDRTDQLALFGGDDERRRRAVEATDAVRRRFGERDARARGQCRG